jgi:hypothetical protein
MTDAIERLCSKVSLTEGEKEGIQVQEGEIAEGRELGARCLVGKLWAGKQVNREAFQTVLSRIWRLVGAVVFKELQDNMWLFEFADEDDKNRVLAGRPWSFDRQILVLNEFDGQCPPSQMEFTKSPIWIQVHDMPLLCMTKGIGAKIGASLGLLEDVDVAGEGVGWGRCLRIRVSIDLFHPLERGRALVVGGKSNWVSFKYEKLPLFCFNCGRVVHSEKGCPEAKPKRLSSAEKEKQWGGWLRADTARWFRSSSQWNGGGHSQHDREATEDGPRADSQPYFRFSENHGLSTKNVSSQAASGSETSVFHHTGGEKMGSTHAANKMAHSVEEQTGNGHALRSVTVSRNVGLQLRDEVEGTATGSDRGLQGGIQMMQLEQAGTGTSTGANFQPTNGRPMTCVAVACADLQATKGRPTVCIEGDDSLHHDGHVAENTARTAEINHAVTGHAVTPRYETMHSCDEVDDHTNPLAHGGLHRGLRRGLEGGNNIEKAEEIAANFQHDVGCHTTCMEVGDSIPTAAPAPVIIAGSSVGHCSVTKESDKTDAVVPEEGNCKERRPNLKYWKRRARVSTPHQEHGEAVTGVGQKRKYVAQAGGVKRLGKKNRREGTKHQQTDSGVSGMAEAALQPRQQL